MNKQNVIKYALRALLSFPMPLCIKCHSDGDVFVSGLGVDSIKTGFDKFWHFNWRCKSCEIIWNREEVFTNNLSDPHVISRKEYKERRIK